MSINIRTQSRFGDTRRRRRKKTPDKETLLRVEWLNWLVEKYGADVVADWQDPPVRFEEWKAARELSAHEAA